jgi:predicted neutral ceramidase superfamily lipid hydrolase
LDSIDKATNLTKFLSPNINMGAVYFLILALPLLAGLALWQFGQKPLWESMLLSYTSLFISGIISMILIKILVWNIRLKSIILSTLIFEAIYSVSLAVSVYLFGQSDNMLVGIIAVAGAFSLIIWLCIGIILGKLKTGLTIGIIQFLVFSFFVAPFFSVQLTHLLAEYALISGVSVLVVLLSANMLLSPVRRNLSVSGFDALSGFANQWYLGTGDLEDLFAQVGTHARLPIGIIGIMAGKQEKPQYIIVPYVHFGPFGKLGGSDAPGSISSALGGSAIVMHSTATHDLNPTSRGEISKIIDAISSSEKGANYFKARGGFIEAAYGNARMHGLVINESILATFTRAPDTTEDTDISVGYLMMEKLKKKYRNAIVADEHNSSAEKITSFDILSEEAGEYLRCTDALLSKTFTAQDMECAISRPKISAKGLASNGVNAILFKAGNKKVAYIVLDGNGISRASKERLENELAKDGTVPIIMTTDSHELNAVGGVVNEIELNDMAISQIADSMHQARTEPFSAAFSIPEAEIQVLGARQSIEIISTVNSIVAMAKFLIPMTMAVLLLFLLAVLSRPEADIHF